MIPVRPQQVIQELCCPPPAPAPTSPPPIAAPLPPLLFLLSKASYYVTLSLITILLFLFYFIFLPPLPSPPSPPMWALSSCRSSQSAPECTAELQEPGFSPLSFVLCRLFLKQHTPDAASSPLFIIRGAVHKCVTLSALHLLSHHSASASKAPSALHILSCLLCSMLSGTSCGCHSADDASLQL